ncbi:MAG TPA: DUF4136 domain-containing protein [Sphingomonadaceae bacterium]|nr:DUF4136 domain-containing protein [Sphingomonadaceae bacterium]
MPHSSRRIFPRSAAVRRAGIACIAALALLPATQAFAGPPAWGGGWGNSGWGGSDWGRPTSSFDRPYSRISPRSDQSNKEGEVEVTRFVVEGDAASALGHGPVKVVVLSNEAPPERGRQPGRAAYDDMPPPGDDAPSDGPAYGPPTPSAASASPRDERENAIFEAAMIDQLVKAGYDTQTAPDGQGQLVELRITHGVAQPAELPRKPVSGEMDVGVSNRGTMMGLGINIDLTKPKKALLSTRVEVRIRDAASDTVLWEGRGDIATRDGSEKWTSQAIATQLAEALFRKFPGKNGETFSLN